MAADNSPPCPGHSYLRSQKAGEKALQDKRFQPAKCAFDQALWQASQDLNIDASTLITILDLRVEAQLRLKNLDAAVKDARTMVRQDRADPRGYLRCGQSSRLKNDFAGAQRWYDQGLKNVVRTHKGYHKLESMSLKTIGKSAAPQSKRRDPLMVLPMDLIHMVLNYLDLWEATSCLRISRTWRNTLLAAHSVWKTFDLLGTRRNVTMSNVKACIRRLPSPPTTVRLEKLTVSATTYLRPYLERWKAVEHLSINLPDLADFTCTGTVSTAIKSLHVGPQCPVLFKVVDDLLHSCNMLQNARFDAVLRCESPRELPDATIGNERPTNSKKTLPELNHLVLLARLRSIDAENDEPLIDPLGLFGDFPNLRDLHCSGFSLTGSNADFSKARRLRHLRLDGSYLERDFRLPSSIDVLACSCSSYRYPVSPLSNSLQSESNQQGKGFETLGNLRILELNRDDPMRFSSLMGLIKESPSAILTTLHLLVCDTELSDLMTLVECGKLSKLTDFGISQSEMSDDSVQRMAADCPVLERVQLDTPRITGVAVKELCTRTAIKTLILTDCLNVSADAIEWARARGVTVVIDRSGEQRRLAGRSVRYG